MTVLPSGVPADTVLTRQALGEWLVEHDSLEEKVPESLRPYLDYRGIGVDLQVRVRKFDGVDPGLGKVLHIQIPFCVLQRFL